MNGKLSAADRFLIGLAVFADVASVLSFLGIQASSQIRWIVVAALTLLGVVASGATFLSSIRLGTSPKGALYPPGYHARRVGISVIALLISVVLGAFLIVRAADVSKSGPPSAPPTISPTK